MRLINAVREWNAQGLAPLRTIAIYTAVDRTAMFVREADEAVLIGPDDPEYLGPSPYLDYAELRRALSVARADAVWPGWGFVSEKAEFARLCRDMDIVFVGPSPEVMERLGDKIASKVLAEEVGVPMAAWSNGPVADVDAAREHAERIGYPLMIKATAGGGGRGIRKVERAEDLAEAFERASSEGAKTAGDATVFMERAIAGGRHVEVQVVADATGDVWTLGVRDCSVQRRNQKVLEESASTALDADQEQLLRSSAAALVKAAGYVNAGTVEFLYEPRERLLSFLEVNTRLQVEHCVTEATTGVDIVKLQLHVAGGGKLAEIAPEAPPARGHAIEARLTAEDPEQGFAPAPGHIEHLNLPAGPGVRVDTGVAAGDTIPPQFDSMIAKIIAWGRDRDEARARLSRALRQTTAVIDGGTTNKAFLLDLLDRPEVLNGDFDTMWLDTMMADGYTPPRRTDVALLAAAIEAQDAHVARQRERLFASAERGRPEVGHETWHQVDVRVGGESYRLRVAQSRGGRYHVELDGKAVDVEAERTGRFERKLTSATRRSRCCRRRRAATTSSRSTAPCTASPAARRAWCARPRPRWSSRSRSRAGDEVTAGDVVAVVESMKLETALQRPGLRPRAGDPGRPEHPGRGRHEAGAAGARHRRRRGQRRRARVAGRASPRRRSRAPTPPPWPPTRSPRCATSCSATTSTSATPVRCWPPSTRPGRTCRPTTRPCSRASSRSSGSSPTSARCRATGAGPRTRASRSTRRARRRATRRSTSTPTCAPATPTPRGCPSRSGPSCAGRCRTTACPTWSSPTRCPRRCTGCSSRTGAPPRTCR